MNIFEGSRRALYAITALTIVFTAWAAWQHEPYIEAGLYQVMPSGDAVPVKNCPGPTGYRVNAGISHSEVMLTLCGNESYEKIRLGKVEVARLEGLLASQRLEKSKDFGSQVFTALIGIWLLSWIIGWVVRGFAGIPRGQDEK